MKEIIMQCAPLLMGIKASNLLILPRTEESFIRQEFLNTPFTCRQLCELDRKDVFLIYHRERIIQQLEGGVSCELLESRNYPMYNFDKMLEELSLRYRNHRSGHGEFPHEIGLFLGYPAEDVRGFIDNRGSNYLYSGYWKVYHNVSQTKELFNQYNEARQMALYMISDGMNIRDIIQNAYSECPRLFSR